mgnify:FL=1
MLNSIKAHSIALISIALLLCIGGCAPANEAAAGINETHLIMATDMSPVEIVSLYFIAQRTDNQELFQSMLAEEFIDDGQALNYGSMSLTIHEIYQVDGEALEMHLVPILDGEKAKELGIGRENIAVVHVRYEGIYDGTKVPFDSREYEWNFNLYRQDSRSPWKISNWGEGYGGL